MTIKQKPIKITTIGGGSGSFMLLSELKKHKDVDLTAIVAMSDSGGSTGTLIDQMGVLPAGDIRQCLVALSKNEKILRELFTYRYQNTFLKGHTFGNIFLSTLEKITNSFEKSLKEASKILNIQGEILPITLEKNDLIIEFNDKTKIIGEDKIDNANILKYKKIYLKNNPKLNPKIKQIIKNADIVIIAPGNFYNSIIPNFLVNGLAQSLKKTKAKVFFVSNLTTKNGHTNNFTTTHFISELYEISSEKNFIDYVIYNKSNKFDEKTLDAYKKENSQPITFKFNYKFYDLPFIGKNLISKKIYKKSKADTVKRSLIRHDSKKLINLIFEIYKKNKIYVFDFDHTIFNAKNFSSDIKKEFKNIKISEDIWAMFQQNNKNLKKFITTKTKNYLFKDTKKILKNIKNKKILLSVGDVDFQKEKIKASGVEKYFNQIIVHKNDKIKALKQIQKENPNSEIIFINDNYNKRFQENNNIKEVLPNIKIVIVDRYKKDKKLSKILI